MKKLMTILAALVALCGPVRAADQIDWFNAGIGANWPTNAAMFGGAWCNGAGTRGRMIDDTTLQIVAEEDEPLSFDATYPKALGDDAAAKDVVIAFSCAFQPFSRSSLPDVPSDAKGAVILVTEEDDPDVAEGGMLYYAAWDSGLGKNWWKPSDAPATTGEVCRISITIRKGADSGFLSVDYILSGVDQRKNIPLRTDVAVSSGLCFTGRGQATSLNAAYEPGESHTLNVVPVTGLTVTNVTADGVSVGAGFGVYFVSKGADVVVYYAAAPGYAMEGDGIVEIGRVTQDTTVDRKNYPEIPAVEALGKYLVGSTTYTNFVDMVAALKDGDTVEMLMSDTLPSKAELAKVIAFRVGEYVLSAPPEDFLTIAADVVFTATAATNLPPFFIRTDCMLTLPSGTEFEDYKLTGADYARVRIGGREWVFYDYEWHDATEPVTMRFYYPGYFDSDCVALTLEGQLGRPVEYDLLAEYDESICQDWFVQDFYWDGETETIIDYVYWYDDTNWHDAPTNGNAVAFPPDRYVACDFYPGSTSIVYKITYDMGGLTGAKNPETNPTEYNIDPERERAVLAAAVPPKEPPYFQRWYLVSAGSGGKIVTNTVTRIDPVAIGLANGGRLDDLELFAEWGSDPVAASLKLRTSAMIAPGKSAARYDTADHAQAAAAAFNADEEGGFLPPVKYTGDGAAYSANFKATANGSTVSVDLTDSAKEKIASKVDSAALSAAANLADPGVSTLTIDNVEPGFYYTVVGGTDLEDVATEGRPVLANGTSVELTKPDLGNSGKAFFRIKAAVK